MKPATEHNWIRWVPTLIGSGLALYMIYYGFDMDALTDQAPWRYEVGDAFKLLGFLWLFRIAVGVHRLLR